MFRDLTAFLHNIEKDIKAGNAKQHNVWLLLEASVSNEDLVDRFFSWFDEGIHKMDGSISSLFTAAQHTCIFYAHSL